MKKPDTWMPIYVGDYLADTGHLSAAEHGAYLLLLFHYWRTGKPLPADDDQLRRIARMDSKEWGRSRNILKVFFSVTETEWRQGRVDKELAAAQRRSETARGKAARSWLQRSPSTCPSEAPAHAPALLGDMLGGCSLLPSPSQKESILEADFSIFWEIYPRHVAKGAAKKAFIRAVRGATVTEIIAGAKRYAAEQSGKDQTFVAHAATWLNAERWGDDPAPNGGKPIEAKRGNGGNGRGEALPRDQQATEDRVREGQGMPPLWGLPGWWKSVEKKAAEP